MMMGGKGAGGVTIAPLQNHYVVLNETGTGAQLQITNIAAADRVSGLIWLVVLGNESGTSGGLGPITGETSRYTSTFTTPEIQIWTYSTSGSELNYLNTQYSDHTYAQLDLYVLNPNLSGYLDGIVNDESGPGSATIEFNGLTVNSVDDMVVAVMTNDDATDLTTTPSDWSLMQYAGTETGGLGGFTGRWIYYLYYKWGGHGTTAVQPGSGDFGWSTGTSYESKLIGFEGTP